MTHEPNKIRVILADDHAIVRSGIRNFLDASDNITVVAEANDGEEAKRAILETTPDVAVLDIQMPKTSGIEVARWARAEHPQIGLLVLTAFDDDPYVMAVLQAGANGFILKTASPEEIIKAIQDVHEGASVLDPGVAHKLLIQIATQKEVEAAVEALTAREHEVLEMVAHGYTNKAIGVQLGISDRTVQGHLAHIFNKMQAGSRTEAVMKAVSLGWLPPDLVRIDT